MVAALQIDDSREWIQWWIETEEWDQYLDEWWQNNVVGYRRYDVPRGVIELDISEED